MTLQDIARAIECVAPLELQESYDNAGLQCGDPHQEVGRVLACLDVTEKTVAEAKRRGCQLILSHHPLLFHGVKCISPEAGYISRVLIEAIRDGIGIYAAHTNLDRAEGGTNSYLAHLLGLCDVQPLSDCGLWGRLLEPMSADSLLTQIEAKLQTRVRYNLDGFRKNDSDKPRLITTLALCTGAGGDFISEAESLGVDAYLTGEIRYHDFFGHRSMLLIEAGHYETEQFAPEIFANILAEACPEIECLKSETEINPSPFLK